MNALFGFLKVPVFQDCSTNFKGLKFQNTFKKFLKPNIVEPRVSGQARIGVEVWEFAFFALKIIPRIGAPFT